MTPVTRLQVMWVRPLETHGKRLVLVRNRKTARESRHLAMKKHHHLSPLLPSNNFRWRTPNASGLASTSKILGVETDTVVPEYLKTKQAAPLMGFSVNTLERWRQLGTGPPFVKIGRNIRYRRSDLVAWIEEHSAEPIKRTKPAPSATRSPKAPRQRGKD